MPAQLTSVKVNEFRHVRPGSEIEFGPQFNVFVGHNGTGKTTLLGLVSALIRNNFHQFVDEGFSISFRMEDEGFTLEGTLTNTVSDQRSSFGFSGDLVHGETVVHIESNDNESVLTHGGRTFTGRAVIPANDSRVLSPGLIVLARVAAFSSDLQGLVLGLPPLSDVAGAMSTIHTRIAEGAETFLELFAQDADHHKRQPVLGVTVVKAEEDESNWCVTHHLPESDVLPQIRAQTDISDTISLGASLGPLAQFIRLSQYQDARLILVRTSFQKFEGGSRWTFGKPQALFKTANGREISHEQLSFGEKRLLAFLIKLYANPATIIVDELANGMHHSWLEECIELLDDSGTQAFLSSQNPLLLDCVPLSRGTYASHHALVVCEFGDSGEMIWRNLNEVEIEDFFRSLDVGLQHISEIMRSKGLW